MLFSAINSRLRDVKSLNANLGMVSKKLLLKSKSSNCSSLLKSASGTLLNRFLDRCKRIRFGVPLNRFVGKTRIRLSDASKVCKSFNVERRSGEISSISFLWRRLQHTARLINRVQLRPLYLQIF